MWTAFWDGAGIEEGILEVYEISTSLSRRSTAQRSEVLALRLLGSGVALNCRWASEGMLASAPLFEDSQDGS